MCRDRNLRGRTHGVLLLRPKGTEATLKPRSISGRCCAFSVFPFFFVFFFPRCCLSLPLYHLFSSHDLLYFLFLHWRNEREWGDLDLVKGWSSLPAPGCAVLLCTGKAPVHSSYLQSTRSTPSPMIRYAGRTGFQNISFQWRGSPFD